VSKISVFGLIIVVLVLVVGLYILLNTDISYYSKATPQTIFVSHQNSSEYETLYLWRERLIDTLLQSFVLVAALAGVLIYVARRWPT